MKSFLSYLNFPFLLLLAYSTYFIYLIHFGIAITFPISLIFIFCTLLYGYKIYMDHIKKPDAHELLEEKWANYDEMVDLKVEALRRSIHAELEKTESKITKLGMAKSFQGIKEKKTW